MSHTAQPFEQLEVSLGERSYPITIGSGLLSDAEIFRSIIPSEQLLIVSNDTVAPIYLQKLRDTCHRIGVAVESIELRDGEKYKDLANASRIYDRLMELRFDRSCCLLALGGGVVGDMTGFAAATYQRGVKFLQVPTTLLSQVDSSVGGKTGVNHPAGKNMIGAFHQPDAVIIDTETLETLPVREYIAGLAEVIKYGLIGDRAFLDWLHENMPMLLKRDNAILIEAIRRSCENKANVVAQDEKESGLRAILNLGHTFGHAIETATGYTHWLHGEAVGYGMLQAIDLSGRLGLLDEKEQQYAAGVLASAGLPTDAPPGVTAGMIKELMGADKKVEKGKLRLVLLRSIGDAFVTAEFKESLLDETLDRFFPE